MKPGKRRGRQGGSGPRSAINLGITEVIIDSVGAKGDGIGLHEGKAVYVPFSLPGERLRVRLLESRRDGLTAEMVSILAPSANRQKPACPYFANPAGACGGCTTQHISSTETGEFKQQLIREALTRRGFDDGVVADIVSVGPGHRRRVDFSVTGGHGAPRIGFHERDSNRIIPIEKCPALVPELAELATRLGPMLAGIAAAGRGGAVKALYSETGLDIVLCFAGEPDLRERERLVAFSAAESIARLSWQAGNGEEPLPIVVQREPLVMFSGTAIVPPPGAFLQASIAGEQAIISAITDNLSGRLPKGARMADLFSGCGPISFALAAMGHVHAVEGNAAMVSAITLAAGRGDLGGRISAERRDLFRRPLAGRELAELDALVFDPPRAGALEQARAIADAGNPRIVVAVSCNPATFARDARILADGGYKLETVIPIDQFPWSAHVELVALLVKYA